MRRDTPAVLHVANGLVGLDAEAKHLRDRLSTLKGIYVGGGRTGGWLERNHGIYGFIDEIGGIYEETTRRVA